MLEAIEGRLVMATRAPKAIVIPTPKLIEDALALSARFRDVKGLSRHAAQRKPLLQGAAAVLVLLGFACGAGVFIFLAGLRTWLTLPAVLVAPLVALGSLLVLFFVFFSWIEGRALAQSLGHRTGPAPGPLARWLRKKLRADLGAVPAIPWLPTGLLVFLPLALLVAAAPPGGIVMILIAVAAPVVYARLDAA
jgi:hypothetical protein